MESKSISGCEQSQKDTHSCVSAFRLHFAFLCYFHYWAKHSVHFQKLLIQFPSAGREAFLITICEAWLSSYSSLLEQALLEDSILT